MSYRDLFPSLPDNARCWVYVAERPLNDAEQQHLLSTLNAFFTDWASHGRPVQGNATILDDRFLLVAGVVQQGDFSGCGIDASVRVVEEAAQHLGMAWLSPLMVFYRDGTGTIQHAPRPAFRKLVAAGNVTAETPVFDVSLTTVGPVRTGAFEQPAGQTWHARVFRIPQPAA